jgi:tetratricopeptide (TPR) repeat protein
MALARIWAQSLLTQNINNLENLKTFQAALDEICQTIEDASLPEHTAEYRYQFQQEYLFRFAKSIATILPQLPALSEKNTTESSNTSTLNLISQHLTALWSKKALYNLLTEDTSDITTSYEAFVDKLLFSNEDIFNALTKELLPVAQLLPAAAYSDAVLLFCLFYAENNPNGYTANIINTNGNDIANNNGNRANKAPLISTVNDLLEIGLDKSKLLPDRLGNTFYTIIKLAHDFPAVSSEPLLRGISKHLALIKLPTPEATMETAIWLAKAGCGKEALDLLCPLQDASVNSALISVNSLSNSTNSTPVSTNPSLTTSAFTAISANSPLYPQLCLALAQVQYYSNRFPLALDALTPLLAKGNATPPEALYLQAQAYAQLRQTDKAIEAFNTFLAKAPSAPQAPEASFLLGTLSLSVNKKDDAQRYFQQTIANYSGTIYAERAKQFLGLSKEPQ